jgi:glutaredoxin-related protein
VQNTQNLGKIFILFLAHVKLGTGFLVASSAFMWYITNNKAWNANLVKQTFTNKYVNTKEINVNYEFVHRFNSESNIFHTLFYRMPLKEFNQLYRYRRVSVQGNFDHDKEVLIESYNHGERGYNVYTPFYYYDNTSINFNNIMIAGNGDEFVEQKLQRGAIVVHRGW